MTRTELVLRLATIAVTALAAYLFTLAAIGDTGTDIQAWVGFFLWLGAAAQASALYWRWMSS